MSKGRPLVVCVVAFLWILGSVSPYAQATPDFNSWLKEFQQEALKSGISESTLRNHLEGLQPIPRIIELDRRQAPSKKAKKTRRPNFNRYLKRVVPESRVKTAVEKYLDNRDLLAQIGSRFAVDPTFVVALWAIESDFGRNTGKFPLVGALATLAHEGRRGDFFRGELLELLKLIEQGAITNPDPRGSWAGAMGQVQFMPSSFRNFALDFDGDENADLWNSTPDALASAANYLARVGWRAEEEWGQQVNVPKNFKVSQTGPNRFRPIKEWRQAGVRGIEGPDSRKAAIILPEGPGGSAYLVYQNFKVLRRWNRSNFFALAVCHLAEEIKKRARQEPQPPVMEQLVGRNG